MYYVKGVKAGSVRIVGTFSYGKYKNRKTAIITVVENEETTDDDDFEINAIEFKNFVNITYDNFVFIMSSENASFTINAKSGYTVSSQSVSCENENVSIESQNMPSMVAYTINCSENGTYDLKIMINSKTKTFSLIYN